MVVFSGVLDTGQVEDQKMMKDLLRDGKKLRAGSEANQLRRLKMLVVNLMVIQFHMKLEKFYCIKVMK